MREALAGGVLPLHCCWQINAIVQLPHTSLHASLTRAQHRCSAMAGATWFDRLARLLSGIQAFTPVPGTHDAILEEYRVGALLNKELTKPDEHRDEELVHTLRVEYRRRQLENAQVGRWGAAVIRARAAAGRWRLGGNKPYGIPATTSSGACAPR